MHLTRVVKGLFKQISDEQNQNLKKEMTNQKKREGKRNRQQGTLKFLFLEFSFEIKFILFFCFFFLLVFLKNFCLAFDIII